MSGRALGPDRRSILKIGAATLAVAATGDIAWARVPAAQRPYKAVFDSRYQDGLAFGRDMDRLGAATAAIQGDVTALWYDDLHYRWKEGPTVLVGLTDASALFCLETLARDAGMRVVFRSGFHRAADGGVERRSQGAATMLALADRLPQGPAWAGATAGLVLAAAAEPPGERASTATRCRAPGAGASHLVAWVIAPAVRA